MSFAPRLAAGVGKVLAAVGIEEHSIQREVETMAASTYAPTASRRVLDSMNDFWNLLDGYWEAGADLTI